MTEKTYDLVSMGRSSIDLYSADVGAAFVDITKFDAFVGGCPTNVAVAATRQGLRTALVTGLGPDPVGDFLVNFLLQEGVEMDFSPRKPGKRTSAVVLGIEPPDRFPLVYYREGCADIELTIDDAQAAPLTDTRALLISGTGLSREPSRSATMYAAEKAHAHGATVYLDIDFRADQWHDPRAFGVVIRSTMPWVDVVIGSEDEIKASAVTDAAQVVIEHSQISDPRIEGDLKRAIETVLASGSGALVLKRGQEGAAVYLPDGEVIEAAPFQVDVLNILGAGDAFAGGLISARTRGLDWQRSLRTANANGAIVVTRPGCANFMPTEEETLAFVQSKGGF
jgi:5-dehydro-2-deoxygluconokinase